MQDFEDRVAVVTGAASGIGAGLARRFAREGMKVVLADVERGALEETRKALEEQGASVLAVETDVASLDSVRALEARAREHFGAVHVLCNNAGVAGGGANALWETTEKDWSWVLGVNLMGVVHGIQAFVPGMLEHGEPGHVVNTSSVLGLSTGGGSTYGVSKHAVTRLSEGLHYDLRAAGSAINVSVLCPGLIATNILTSQRNRPAHLREEDRKPPAGAEERLGAMQRYFRESGMSPDEVGEIVFKAIEEERFYVLTHDWILGRVRVRMEDILEQRTPSPLPPPGMGRTD